MADVYINTEGVLGVANNLQAINTQLHKDFIPIQTAMKKLDTSWDGPASVDAMQKYGEINKAFEGDGYKILQDYVNCLTQHVVLGYENTEETNTSLADNFK